MKRFFLPLLACTAAAVFGIVSPAAAQSSGRPDDLVAEFKKFYNPKRSSDEKVEMIFALKQADPLRSVEVLADVLGDPEERVRRAAIETVGSYRSPEAAAFLRETILENKREKDRRRIAAAIECLGLMKDEASVDAIRQAFLKAKDFDIRRAAGTAAGSIATEATLPLLAALLQDPDAALRVVAVDGLSSFGRADAPLTEASDSGEPPERIKDALVRVLGNDPDWQVRAAAVDAIRHLRFKEGVQPLIDRMRVEEGRIRQDAYEALRELTFLQYGDDPAEWQGFWDRAGAQFKLPDLDVVMAARKKRQAEGGKYTPAAPGFAGIETKSRRILFVIDVSRSMEEEVIDTERFREGDKDYPSLQRLEIVKQELIRTVEGFDENVYFNILAFATKMNWWKKDMVPANVLNRNSAVDFTRKLSPIGGGAETFRVRARLKSNAVLKEAMTNTYGALMAALGVPEDEDPSGSKADRDFNEKVDTIYFLTDGNPTTGKLTMESEILDAVRRVNELRKVRIHAIAIGDFKKTFLKELAEQNGGVYVDMGG